jgi:SAM-dependent methyltransferase
VGVALTAGTACGLVLTPLGSTGTRRLLIAAGFPLSIAATSAAAIPGWAWLVPLALLALVYPLNAWRDAPFFPTPGGALASLAASAPLAPGARVLDAGCGLAHAIAELRRAYPDARIDGIEWSWPLALAARLRCRLAGLRAAVEQGDMWQRSWSGYDLVYLFQRPESLPRAIAKATSELRPGAWLASLEFEAVGVTPHTSVRGADGRTLWLYRAPFVTAATSRDGKPLKLHGQPAENLMG